MQRTNCWVWAKKTSLERFKRLTGDLEAVEPTKGDSWLVSVVIGTDERCMNELEPGTIDTALAQNGSRA